MTSTETITKLNKIDAILLCGGKGSRLQPLLKGRMPKSLLSIGGHLLIEHSLAALPPDQVSRLIFAVDHQAEQIIDWVESAELQHDEVVFSYQTEPGIVGAIYSALEHVRSARYALCNTDEVRDGLKLDKMAEFHDRQGLLGTMAVGYCDKLFNHRVLMIDDSAKVVDTHLKPTVYKQFPKNKGPINAGFMLMEMEAASLFDRETSAEWGGIINPLVNNGEFSAFVIENMRYCNAGTPEEIRDIDSVAAQTDILVRPLHA